MTEKPGIISLVGAVLVLVGSMFIPWVVLNRLDEGAKLLKGIPVIGSIISGLLTPTGWQLSASPFTSGLLRILIFGALIAGLIGLIASIYEVASGNGLSAQIGFGLAGFNGILLTLLILNIPTVLCMGNDDNTLVAAAAAAGDAKIGYGFWMVLLGLVIMAVGLAVDLGKEPETTDYSYAGYRGR
ncbi:MAG: hypothetical protein HXX20_11820 [Chloroflexi bacterium]|nr:hypothetical protein [Chloroflexota bacterium]